MFFVGLVGIPKSLLTTFFFITVPKLVFFAVVPGSCRTFYAKVNNFSHTCLSLLLSHRPINVSKVCAAWYLAALGMRRTQAVLVRKEERILHKSLLSWTLLLVFGAAHFDFSFCEANPCNSQNVHFRTVQNAGSVVDCLRQTKDP